MGEKNNYINNYIDNIVDNFNSRGIKIEQSTIDKVKSKYFESSASLDEIIAEINQLVEQKLEELRKRQELIEKGKKEIRKAITDLPVDSLGITLNMQQIDLLNIVSANEETINKVLESIKNLSQEEKQAIISSGKSIDDIKRALFKAYQDSLTSYKETNFSLDELGKNRELSKRINFVLNNSGLSEEQKQTFINIVKNNKLYDIPGLISSSFEEKVSDSIFATLSSFMPTEKHGIKETGYESFERLFQHLQKYQVINLDDIAKYSHYVRQDGKYNREDLIKAFDFAKSQGKQTRLNTLLFYMDTPEKLDNMPYSEGKSVAKKLLEDYVDDITKVIAEYNNNCVQNGDKPTVRTIEILNEMLNRFAMDGDAPYEYRGHIDTDNHRIERNNPNYDNLKAGWLRFFEIEELCEIMEIARKNLPNVNFMINECTLEDNKKIEPFKRLVLDKIKRYEQEHGIKLIDSIGTQMHIDSSVSKDDIRTMFEGMAQFGLPIEVTEFDMAIDQEFIKSHSEEEIEQFKRLKIAEFCDVVVEMQEKANITGVSIWSVSDSQNFVVDIANGKIYQKNLERQKSGLEPIPYLTTLYGGYYDKNMSDIIQTKTNDFGQVFNYHTHTSRSGHSEFVSDEEMLLEARKTGLSMIGFSEHIPNPELLLPDEDHRMLFSESKEYIASINELKNKYPDMTILSGFEAEFDPVRASYLCDMKSKVDYMILGQHFVNRGLSNVPFNNNPNYPIEYANMVSKAIDSGIFDIVAHPDLFMEYRDTMQDEESKKLFDENARIASQIICEKARDMGIPIELNLASALNNNFGKDGNLQYPHPLFWEVASEIKGLQVLKGIDAHSLSAFRDLSSITPLISSIEEKVKDKMIKGEYNPQIARSQNVKLQEAFNKTRDTSLTFETHMISSIVNGTLSQATDDMTPEQLGEFIGSGLNSTVQGCVDAASQKDKKTVEEISIISESTSLSPSEKKGKLERKKRTIEETNMVLANQQRIVEDAKGNVFNAMTIGCERKEEYSNMMSQMTQHKSTSSEEQKSKIESHISDFQNKKGNTNSYQQVQGQAYQLKRVNNNKNGSNNSSNGFVNVVMISLITTFIVGFIAGIVYMLCKIWIGG